MHPYQRETPTGHRLGTPRPMRTRVTTTGGRFPGSRVIAFGHLPRDDRSPVAFMAVGSPLTVAGAAAELHTRHCCRSTRTAFPWLSLAGTTVRHARIGFHASQEVRPPTPWKASEDEKTVHHRHRRGQSRSHHRAGDQGAAQRRRGLPDRQGRRQGQTWRSCARTSARATSRTRRTGSWRPRTPSATARPPTTRRP